ncbi:MAG: endonuclease V [Halobacteriota archaeon]
MAVKDASEFNALRQLQTDIAKQVVLEDPASEVASIGAVAQSFDESLIFSSAVVVDTQMNVIDGSVSIAKTAMPYVPGFLFFREGPAVIATVEKLHGRPDVLIVHGCGINHPRFAGLASHVGVILNTSTIGVSKKALCGEYVEPAQAGRPTALTFSEKPLGFVLKTVAGTKPIFISPGNRISLQGALRIVQRCVVSHRLPEPLRLAHIKARQLRSEMRFGELVSLRTGDGVE